MAKKRKLNSNNPKYLVASKDNSPVVKERRLMCNAKVRDVNGNIVQGKTVPVHGIWYENDPIKATKVEKWWKKSDLN